MILITDSCSDITLENAKKLNIEIIPLTIHIGEKAFKDQIDISSQEVLDKINEGYRPTTSQANPEFFIQFFNEKLKEDNDILYAAFSSELSGTYQSAVIAREEILSENEDANIIVIDTHAASYGLGLIIERAARLMNDGASFNEVVELVNKDMKQIKHLFTVNDLDYLAKGGRLSKGQAFLGGLLNVKPLLHMEHGKLVPIEKHRGEKKLLKSIVEKAKADGASGHGHISHANNLKTAEELKNKLLDETNLSHIEISVIGPTIGSHTGNKMFALFYLGDES